MYKWPSNRNLISTAGIPTRKSPVILGPGTLPRGTLILFPSGLPRGALTLFPCSLPLEYPTVPQGALS